MSKGFKDTPVWLDKLKMALSYIFAPIIWLSQIVARITRGQKGAEQDVTQAQQNDKQINDKKAREDKAAEKEKEVKTAIKERSVSPRKYQNISIFSIKQEARTENRGYVLEFKADNKKYSIYLDEKLQVSKDDANLKVPKKILQDFKSFCSYSKEKLEKAEEEFVESLKKNEKESPEEPEKHPDISEKREKIGEIEWEVSEGGAAPILDKEFEFDGQLYSAHIDFDTMAISINQNVDIPKDRQKDFLSTMAQNGLVLTPQEGAFEYVSSNIAMQGEQDKTYFVGNVMFVPLKEGDQVKATLLSKSVTEIVDSSSPDILWTCSNHMSDIAMCAHAIDHDEPGKVAGVGYLPTEMMIQYFNPERDIKLLYDCINNKEWDTPGMEAQFLSMRVEEGEANKGYKVPIAYSNGYFAIKQDEYIVVIKANDLTETNTNKAYAWEIKNGNIQDAIRQCKIKINEEKGLSDNSLDKIIEKSVEIEQPREDTEQTERDIARDRG